MDRPDLLAEVRRLREALERIADSGRDEGGGYESCTWCGVRAGRHIRHCPAAVARAALDEGEEGK